MFIRVKDNLKTILTNLNSNNFDFTNIFIDPIWYTLIKTFFEKNNLDLNQIKFSKESMEFLTTLWFFNQKDFDLSNLKMKKILPIKTIDSSEEEINDISEEFEKLLKEYLIVEDKRLLEDFYTMTSELLNNIVHHSWKRDVFDNTEDEEICSNFQTGQYFLKSNFIQIAIVDSGIWIYASIKKKHKNIKTTQMALEKAFLEGVTGGYTHKLKKKDLKNQSNRWIGLTKCLNIVKENKWDLLLWTKDCLFTYEGKTWKKNYENFDNNLWTWTFIVFNIYIENNKDNLIKESKTIEDSWIDFKN